MPLALPVLAAIGVGKLAAIAGVGVGGTALGLAVSFREKMKHTTTPVTDLMSLSEGDHISLHRKEEILPFRHAIIVESVQDAQDKIKVVYHSGSKSGARVEFMEVDLCDHARNEELVKHQYEVLICYPAQEVAARAMSLCSQYNTTDRREVLRMYWPFFADDEHFANWCQIGFTDGMKSSFVAVMTDYTRTLVSDVTRLSEGDHIMTEDGLSGIVVRVEEKTTQVEIARFPSEDHRRPALVVINDITRQLYRLDYDIAVGVSGHTAKDVALNETTQPTEPMPYSSSDEFAVWCKTLLRPTVEWRVAAALAAARMTGRLWAWVHAVDELRPGDHVAFNCGTIYYYQHAIVTGIEGRQVSMIFLVGNVADISMMVVQSISVDVSKYLKAENLCKYFYDVRDWYDPDTVIARATSLVGSTADKLPFKDPQHFAIWCKTGTYQLHC